MGVIDSIVRSELIDSPETISSDFTSNSVDMSGVEESFSVQLDYSNGNGSVDMTFSLEVSVDGNAYVPITETEFDVTDDSGVMIWEVVGRGVNFLRVATTVVGGQLTIDNISYSGNRRH